MSKDYNGDEKRSQVNAAFRILINTQQQTHSCVKKLGDDLSRNSARTVANGVKIDGVLKFNEKCDKRMTSLELWKAQHVGQGEGEEKKSSKFNTKTTLICTIAVALITLAGFWYMIIEPIVNVQAAIVEIRQELLDE